MFKLVQSHNIKIFPAAFVYIVHDEAFLDVCGGTVSHTHSCKEGNKINYKEREQKSIDGRNLITAVVPEQSSVSVSVSQSRQEVRQKAVGQQTFECCVVCLEWIAQLPLGVLIQFSRVEVSSQAKRILQQVILHMCKYYRCQSVSKIVLLSPKLSNIFVFLIDSFLILLQTLIELLDELFIFDDVGRRKGARLIEVHVAFEIDVELILCEENETSVRSEGERTEGKVCYFGDQHQLIMICRIIRKVKNQQQDKSLLCCIKWRREYYDLNQIQTGLYYFISMITHHLFKRTLVPFANTLPLHSFCTTSTQSAKEKIEKEAVPLFRKKAQDSPSTTETSKHSTKQQLQALVAKINEANQYFLGIRVNTNYLKVHKTAKFADILQQNVNVGLKDFPADIAKEEGNFGQFQEVKGVLEGRAVELAFSHCNKDAILKRMQKLIRSYLVCLTTDGRFKQVEPNFQRQLIKLRNGLKSKCTLRLKDQQALPQIKLSKLTLMKGVQVYRNKNYSTDSYSKDQIEATDNIITYQLYKQRNERYPEPQWESTKMINARFQLVVRGGPVVEVLEKDHVVGSTANVMHRVVIEADLVPPPAISEHQLTPEQYLRSYRLLPQNLTITNFDQKNDFFSLTFSEQEKKNTLINEIE